MAARAMCECSALQWPWLVQPTPPLSERFAEYHRSAAHVLARALVRKNLQSPPLLIEQSQVLLRLGATQSAVAVARAATTCGGSSAAAWYNLAHVYVESGCPR